MGGLVQFEDGKVIYYPYTPSRVAGLVFVALFCVFTVAHLIYMCFRRTWFIIPLVLGGICEIFGYYGRAWAGDLPNSPRPFMLQLMLILVAPVFISGTVYVTLGKFKQAVLDIPKRRCSPTVLFVLTDIIAFCSQIGGSLVQITGNLKIMEIGDHVVLGGLVFQLFIMAIYFILVCKFYQNALHGNPASAGPWRRYTLSLGICVLAIWIRNLVRAIEFAQGFYGFISQHEAMLYIFDAFLMLLVLILLGVFHPDRLFRRVQDWRGEKVASTVYTEPFELERFDRNH